MKRMRTLSRREREIMDIVYRSESVTANEVHEQIPDPPSYSAVRATLPEKRCPGNEVNSMVAF